MSTEPGSEIPSKSVFIFRFILAFVVSCGIAEMVEVFLQPHFSESAFLFELLEHTILVSLLLVFMTKYVTNPMLREIELRRDSEQRLLQSEAKNRNIIDAMPDAVLRVDADGVVLEFQPKQISSLRFKVGDKVSDYIPTDVVVSFLNCFNSVFKSGENQKLDLMFKHDKEELVFHVFNFVKSSNTEITIFIRDITRRKIYEEQLKFLGSHDSLTGLYNRTYYEAEIERLLASRRFPVSIVIIDLDGLKAINDLYGHAAGDKLINKAASVLKKAFRADDLVARTGGDEFTIILPESSPVVLNTSVARIEECLKEANKIEDGYSLRFSLGTAVAESSEKLLGAIKMADLKMYRNKAERKALLESKV